MSLIKIDFNGKDAAQDLSQIVSCIKKYQLHDDLFCENGPYPPVEISFINDKKSLMNLAKLFFASGSWQSMISDISPLPHSPISISYDSTVVDSVSCSRHSKVLDVVARWVNCGDASDVNMNNCLDVFGLADFLGITNLFPVCMNYLGLCLESRTFTNLESKNAGSFIRRLDCVIEELGKEADLSNGIINLKIHEKVTEITRNFFFEDYIFSSKFRRKNIINPIFNSILIDICKLSKLDERISEVEWCYQVLSSRKEFDFFFASKLDRIIRAYDIAISCKNNTEKMNEATKKLKNFANTLYIRLNEKYARSRMDPGQYLQVFNFIKKFDPSLLTEDDIKEGDEWAISKSIHINGLIYKDDKIDLLSSGVYKFLRILITLYKNTDDINKRNKIKEELTPMVTKIKNYDMDKLRDGLRRKRVNEEKINKRFAILEKFIKTFTGNCFKIDQERRPDPAGRPDLARRPDRAGFFTRFFGGKSGKSGRS